MSDHPERSLLPPLRIEVHKSNPEVPVEVQRLRDVMAFSWIPVRVAATVASVSGAITLLLAVIGLYGVASIS
jgi:hypothetical protein